MFSSKTLHLAKIIITNDKEPIFNGGLLVENKKIKCVGKKEDFGSLENYEVFNHGDSLICPGFINLHTHLAYSNIKKLNGENGLFPWLEELISKTATWTEKDFYKSTKAGIEEALSTGTTFIVENTPSEAAIKAILESPLGGLIGIEVFGSDENEAENIFQKALEQINSRNNRIDFTFSPHAPYDVSKPLWKELINWSNENKKILLTHLEESPDEKLWWQNKSGNGPSFWKKINKLESKLKYWKKYFSGIDFLNQNNFLSDNIVAAHLCQATNDELKVLKEKAVKLVHCPRSNYYLNNGLANLKAWEENGFLWGLGTDSTASNDNLDLLEELRFTLNLQKIKYNYKLSPNEAFKAITLNAAKVIKKDHELSCLKSSYNADFLVYSLEDISENTCKDPYNLIVFNLNNKKNLNETWINGEKAWIKTRILNKI